MGAEHNTIALVARHLLRALSPLIDAGRSLGSFKRMMDRLGFEATDMPPAYSDLATQVEAGLAALEVLPASPSPTDYLALLDKARGLFQAIKNLASSPPPGGVDPGAYAAEIGDRLFELLLTDYLASEATAAYNLLASFNVIRSDLVPAGPGRVPHVRTQFRWAELPKIISTPADLPQRVYKWGQADFDIGQLIEDLAGLGIGLRFPIRLRETPKSVLEGYTGLSSATLGPLPPSLEWPFFYGRAGDTEFEAAFRLRPLPAQGGVLPGIVLEPHIPPELPVEIQLHPQVKMRLRAGTNAGQLFGFTLRPGQVALRYPLAPGSPPPAAGVGVGFDFKPASPALLVGDASSSRVELGGASLDLGGDVSGTAVSLTLGAELTGLKVVIGGGDGDSFIRKIVGDGETAFAVPLGIEWSGANPLRFKGSAGFEVALHPHLKLGPVSVDDVDIKLTVPLDPPARVKLELGAGISGKLGPLSFVVRGIGLRSTAVFEPGNAGPFDLSLGFKPPTGVGLAIDAGGFTGGGFLFCDPDKGEYAGGLELTFAGTISVRAVGILTTRLPEGESGFSLLILIVSEFPPIQLSFGFTLLGVGGLLGLNRTALLDELGRGVRDGSLNSILFPKDVVVNANRIIADLKRIFPAADGHFLIGPMAKLGWGTPTLVSVSIGLILDLPRPAFAVLGILRLALPAEDVALLNLQVSFVGSVDFESGQFMFDASLFDSRVMTFTLTGDMAIRIFWKDNANFLLTAGGFHPAYTPPPMNLGQLARLGIVLFQGNPHVTAEAYFAVTSNTVQFGARIEAYYGVSAFNVQGFLGLDVLITFNPFHFVAEIAASVSVRSGSHVLFSIRLQFMFEGPSPWHAKGTGSFEIGFVFTVTISIGFDVTIGQTRNTLLEPFDVLGAVALALANPGNWRPVLPTGSRQGVALRELAPDSKDLVLHPFGALEVGQKIVPLNVPIQRFGSRASAAGSRFEIAEVKLGGESAGTNPTQEEFAPAQFFALSDAEKLSRSSFAKFDAGVLIGGDLAPRTDRMRTRDVTYELLYLPQHHPLRLRFALSALLGKFARAGSALGRSALSPNQRGPSALSEKVEAHSEQFAIVSSDTLAIHDANLVFGDATSASLALGALVKEQPELADRLQAVPMTTALAA